VAVRQNIKMLAPHFPPFLVPRFVDQQVRDSVRAALAQLSPSSRPALSYRAASSYRASASARHRHRPCLVAVASSVLCTRGVQMEAREEIKGRCCAHSR
jgi:hypothetical protein